MTSWSPQPYQAPTHEQVEAALRPALPTQPREYPDFYRTRRNRWFKPLLAILMAGALWVVVQVVLGVIGFVLDPQQIVAMTEAAQTGRAPSLDEVKMTPMLFTVNNLSIAAAIPVALLTQWAVWGQRPKWLSSVAGGFRWGWFARCLAVTVPIWVVMVVAEYVAAPPEDVRWRGYTIFMIVVILLTTPFQAAGEEYLMRGLETRAIASWIPNRTVGWVVATIVSSLTFMALHLAQDLWLNFFYLTFGALASYVTWRTGGLEAAVAVHVTNNLLSEALMPWTDFSDMMNRSAGKGDPSVLLPIAGMTLAIGLLIWMAKRQGVMVVNAPGVAEVDAAVASIPGTPGAPVPGVGPAGYAVPVSPQQAFPQVGSPEGMQQPGYSQGGQSGYPQGGQPGYSQGGQSGYPQGGQPGYPQGYPQQGVPGQPPGSEDPSRPGVGQA